MVQWLARRVVKPGMGVRLSLGPLWSKHILVVRQVVILVWWGFDSPRPPHVGRVKWTITAAS